MSPLELFHFLRPWWLFALMPIVILWWVTRRRDLAEAGDGKYFAPHLHEALTLNRASRRGFRSADGAALVLITITLAAAGPVWDKQSSPWFSETSPLIVAIEVSDSMRSSDLLPTRLDRARFKVLDLIAERTGSPVGLIAYAGSAHVVMPPTTDIEIIKTFLESLDPAIMPYSGSVAAAVPPLAQKLLDSSTGRGTLLFVNDGFEAADVDALTLYTRDPAAVSIAAWIVGTEEGGVALLPDGSLARNPDGGPLDTTIDPALLRQVERDAGVTVVRVGTGQSDIRRLLRQFESNLQQADDSEARWRDRSWWLLWPAALLVLFWFRRGWTMQW